MLRLKLLKRPVVSGPCQAGDTSSLRGCADEFRLTPPFHPFKRDRFCPRPQRFCFTTSVSHIKQSDADFVVKETCAKADIVPSLPIKIEAIFLASGFYPMSRGSIRVALGDIVAAARRYSLVGLLGWQDVRQRYRRSALGPFWLTISMGVMIGTIGIVFGQIFNAPMKEFLPFLAAGMIFWTFMSSVVTEGCTGFISVEGIIKQLPIPLFVHILRVIWRNVLILGHNIVILPLIFLAVGKSVGPAVFLSIPGFLLVIINLAWVALILGVLCARYRDLPQIIGSVLQVVFYLTPIMWMPSLLPQRAGLYLLDANPIFHVLEIVRAPLLGQFPNTTNWLVSVVLALLGWSVALVMYGRYKRRIPYWL